MFPCDFSSVSTLKNSVLGHDCELNPRSDCFSSLDVTYQWQRSKDKLKRLLLAVVTKPCTVYLVNVKSPLHGHVKFVSERTIVTPSVRSRGHLGELGLLTCLVSLYSRGKYSRSLRLLFPHMGGGRVWERD